MIRAVTVAMIPAWQVREKITLRAAFDKILSNRIARNALESLVQVRRLLGMCIVAGRVRGAGGAQRGGDGVSGTLGNFRKTEFGHLPWVAAGTAPAARE